MKWWHDLTYIVKGTHWQKFQSHLTSATLDKKVAILTHNIRSVNADWVFEWFAYVHVQIWLGETSSPNAIEHEIYRWQYCFTWNKRVVHFIQRVIVELYISVQRVIVDKNVKKADVRIETNMPQW